MIKKILAAGLFSGALLSASVAGSVAGQAQEVTLKLHQFLPSQATIPKLFLKPWAEKVEKESGGRIKISHFPSMQLGGRPPALFDQVKDGVADIVWTLPGYTPGRFPCAEVFELPFMMTNAEATSKAFNDYAAKYCAKDFKDVKVLAVHVHGPGMFHVKGNGIHKLEDMKGKKLRGPTRIINSLLKRLGAVPIGMPLPAVPSALAKGVIEGTVIPWEVTRAFKIAELTKTHTEFGGDHALYTAAFIFAMNKAKYDALPADLKKVIDNNSGAETGGWAGRVMQEQDAPAKKVAVDRGNTIVTIEGAELQRWKDAAKPVVAAWIAEMNAKGRPGQAMVDDARALIAKYSK